LISSIEPINTQKEYFFRCFGKIEEAMAAKTSPKVELKKIILHTSLAYDFKILLIYI